jgi:hypothetical protein
MGMVILAVAWFVGLLIVLGIILFAIWVGLNATGTLPPRKDEDS